MLRQAALSWWQCASRILCHHANAARRSPQLSSTLGCKPSSALPPSLNTNPMRQSCPAAVELQANRNQLGCGCAPAISALSRSGFLRLGIDQTASPSHRVLRKSMGCQLLTRRSRARDRASRSGFVPHQLHMGHGYGSSSCARASACSALCAGVLRLPSKSASWSVGQSVGYFVVHSVGVTSAVLFARPKPLIRLLH